jgi:hypothetical protein
MSLITNMFYLICSLTYMLNQEKSMDYYKQYGSYFEKEMITGRHIKFICIETEDTFNQLKLKEGALRENNLSEQYERDIYIVNNYLLIKVDYHRQFGFLIPKSDQLLYDIIVHISLYILKGQDNTVMFEIYPSNEFDDIVRQQVDLNELELVKIHKNALSKLYFSNKTGKYVLITCDQSDLKSKDIKAGDVFIFDNIIDLKKTRFYEDS